MKLRIVFVGLDYHQRWIQVCIMDHRGNVLVNRRCPNDREVIATLVHRYSRRVQASIEACCGAAELAEELIDHEGWSVNLAHPGYVARMKQGPDKTDFGDARVLADLERVGYLPCVWLAPKSIRELRRVVRFRQQLAAQKRDVKLRIRALLRDGRVARPAAKPWTVPWMQWLKTTAEVSEQSRWILDHYLKRLEELLLEIRAVEKRLVQMTKEDKVVEQLLCQKGIGLITAMTLRAEIGRFDRFRTGKQLSRFCGLSPRNASSGERQADAGLVKAGNRQLRSVLIEAAHRLARYECRWIIMKAKMRRRGKPGSLVAAAIANRWVRWLYHQMQTVNQAA